MQYDREKFNDYFKNYMDIKSRIIETGELINKLTEDEKIRYQLNEKIVEELKKGLNRLYKDFVKSEGFPFYKDEYHFFVSRGTYLVDAITDVDSSELNKEENMLLSDSIASIYKYNPNDYTKDDIPLIKVLYLKNKDSYVNPVTLCDAIKSDSRVIKNSDKKEDEKMLKMMKR